MSQESKANRNRQRQASYQFRVSTLLTLIGLWLALPTTCGVLQRMTDTLTSLDVFSRSATVVIVIKLITDTCLLGFYGLGLFLLFFIGITGWFATKTVDVIEDTISDGIVTVKASYAENKPKVKMEMQKRIPEIKNSVNTAYTSGKAKINNLYDWSTARFPKLGSFLDKFREPFSPE